VLEEGRISGNQAIKILTITVVATAFLAFPGFVVLEAGVDAWLTPVIAIPGALALALTLTRLAAHFPEQTAAEYSQLVLGRGLGRLVGLVFAWFFFSLSFLVLRLFGAYMSLVFLNKTPLVVILSVMAFLVVLLVRNGLECIARVNDILGVIVVLAIVFILLLVAKELDIRALLPLLAQDFWALAWAARLPLALMGEMVVLLFIFPYLEKPEQGVGITLRALVFLVIFLTVITMAPIMLFGAGETARLPYPVMSLAHMVRIVFFENLQAIIMTVWVGGIFIKIGVFLWCAVLSLCQSLNLKEYRPLVPPLGILLVVFALTSAENHIELLEILHYAVPLYSLFFAFLLPLFLLLAVNIRAWLDPSFPRRP